MMFDSFYNSNPNLRLKILRDLITKFRGYIAASEIENTFEIFGGGSVQSAIKELLEVKNIKNFARKFSEKENISDIEKQIIEKWMSGHYGSYCTHDLLCNPTLYTDIKLNPLTEKNYDVISKGGLIDALAIICSQPQKSDVFPDIRFASDDAANNYFTMRDICGQYEYSSDEQLTKEYFDAIQETHIKEAIVEDFNNAEEGIEEYKKSKEVKTKEEKTPDIDLFFLEGDSKYEYQYKDKQWKYRTKVNKEDWLPVKTESGLKKLNAAYQQQLDNPPKASLKKESEVAKKTPHTIQTFSAFLENNPQRMPYYAAKANEYVEAAINENLTDLNDNNQFPNMASFIFRKPVHNRGSRNDNYLSVFFSAISPLELSRCTPYLSLTFYTKKDKGSNLGKLDQIGSMRFKDGINGVFETLPDLNGIFDSKVKDFIGDKEELSTVNYMDLFLSPQTMVNGNINSSAGKSFKDISNLNDDLIDDLNNPLDPLTPLLSLKSFNATINSGGNFMITNRRAKLSITLHDRSRLNEVAPFVSLSQIARTLVKVEHGWSHPDGDIVRSNNEIGKFLNSLRETHMYMLNSSDFSFSGNQVDINMTLDFWGASDFKSTHVAEGNYKDAKDLKAKIIDVINDLERTNTLQSQLYDSGFTLQATPSADSENPEDDQKSINENNLRVLKHVQIIRNSVDAVKILLKTSDIKKINKMIDDYSFKKDKKETYFHAEVLIEYFLALANASLINLGKDPDGDDITPALIEKDPTSLIELLGDENSDFINSFKDLENKARKNLAERFISKLESMTGTEIIKREDGGFDRKLNTPDPFTSQLCHVYYDTESINDEEELGGVDIAKDYPEGHISLGKVISNLVALPLSAGENYEEVQILFYPINNFAAGARKYTTASLPIEIKSLKKEIYKVIENEGDCTIRGMFDIISNYFQNNNLLIYGLTSTSFGTDAKEIEEKIRAEPNFDSNVRKKFEALNPNINYLATQAEINRQSIDKSKKGKLEKSFDKKKEAAEKAYISGRIADAKAASLKTDLEKIYNNDNLGMSNTTYFKKPVIHLEIETMPKIVPAPAQSANAGDIEKRIFDSFKVNFNPTSEDILVAKGIDNSKRILKIHVFDENASSRPAETMFMDGLVSPETFFPTAGILSEFEKQEKGNAFMASKNIKKFKAAANAYVSKMSVKEIKQFVSRAFPTIRYGSQQSVVKSVNISSNTSDEIVNARLMNAIAKNEKERTEATVNKKSSNIELLEEFIIPSSVDMSLYGCPFITMGLNIFVDMQTGTDIDNVYMVGDVTHNISAGEYSTNVSLYLPQIGTARDMRSRLEGAINRVDKEKLAKAMAEAKQKIEEEKAFLERARQNIRELGERRRANNFAPHPEPGSPKISLADDPFGGPGKVEGIGSVYSPSERPPRYRPTRKIGKLASE